MPGSCSMLCLSRSSVMTTTKLGRLTFWASARGLSVSNPSLVNLSPTIAIATPNAANRDTRRFKFYPFLALSCRPLLGSLEAHHEGPRLLLQASGGCVLVELVARLIPSPRGDHS